MRNRNVLPVTYTVPPSIFFSVPHSMWSFFSSNRSRELIGQCILPAQARAEKTIETRQLQSLADAYRVLVQRGMITTADGTNLDTIQITPNSTFSSSVAEKHYIIKFNGNGMLYQDVLANCARDADQLQATVIAFNYRGVGSSSGIPKSIEDLVNDGIAQVQRLLDHGVDAKKITLDGLSLGGAVATLVAKHFHDQKQRVYLWNDRSLSSISKAATGLFLLSDLPPMLQDTSAALTHSSFSLALKSSKWEVNVADAYQRIPQAYKGYMVVAKKSDPSDTNKLQSNGDGVIHPTASLHAAVKVKEKSDHASTCHKMLAQHSIFVGGQTKQLGGHNLARDQLISKDNPTETGQHVFENFIRNHR
ncbi:MAG: alpha/beta hydrolase [Gammaproteobacteria bacterium]|nr:alpha/beta hydrolase [Gammaproteobacteria bacterium]